MEQKRAYSNVVSQRKITSVVNWLDQQSSFSVKFP